MSSRSLEALLAAALFGRPAPWSAGCALWSLVFRENCSISRELLHGRLRSISRELLHGWPASAEGPRNEKCRGNRARPQGGGKFEDSESLRNGKYGKVQLQKKWLYFCGDLREALRDEFSSHAGRIVGVFNRVCLSAHPINFLDSSLDPQALEPLRAVQGKETDAPPIRGRMMPTACCVFPQQHSRRAAASMSF